MGSVRDAYVNIMCKSFFATFKCDLLDRQNSRTVTEARRDVLSFFDAFYTTPAGTAPRSPRSLRRRSALRGTETGEGGCGQEGFGEREVVDPGR